jgi:hypothetical protein
MTTMNNQLGIAEETTYGTVVTPTRFLEYNSCGIKLQRGMTESKGLRSGTRVQRSDRFMPYTIGAAGAIELDVPTKGFGMLLKHMLGGASIGTVTDANYLQTFIPGTLLGDMLTIQEGKALVGTATVQPFTWHGAKVVSWELSCDVDGILVCTIEFDCEDEDTSTSLATAAYISDTRVFSFDGCAVQIGGSSFEASSVSFTGDNNLKTDRRFLTGSSLKKQPLENGHREYGFSMEAEFTSLAQYDRYRSATAAGQLAAIVATFTGPVAHGGATLPQLVVTIPAARFDQVDVETSGPENLEQSLSGIATDNGSAAPITITYRTTDAAI